MLYGFSESSTHIYWRLTSRPGLEPSLPRVGARRRQRRSRGCHSGWPRGGRARGLGLGAMRNSRERDDASRDSTGASGTLARRACGARSRQRLGTIAITPGTFARSTKLPRELDVTCHRARVAVAKRTRTPTTSDEGVLEHQRCEHDHQEGKAQRRHNSCESRREPPDRRETVCARLRRFEEKFLRRQSFVPPAEWNEDLDIRRWAGSGLRALHLHICVYARH